MALREVSKSKTSDHEIITKILFGSTPQKIKKGKRSGYNK